MVPAKQAHVDILADAVAVREDSSRSGDVDGAVTQEDVVVLAVN